MTGSSFHFYKLKGLASEHLAGERGVPIRDLALSRQTELLGSAAVAPWGARLNESVDVMS